MSSHATLVQKSNSRSTGFQKSYIDDYGVKPLNIDGKIVSLKCQFCIHFGREIQNPEERKRQQRESDLAWKPPYRSELFRKHYKDQHLTHWTKYQSLSIDDKRSYFENQLKFKSTLHNFVGTNEPSIVFRINPAIVDTIIAAMFFHPDDHGSTTQERALKLFKLETNGSYSVTIKNPTQFQYGVDLIAIGLSFRQTSAAIAVTRKRITTSTVVLSGVSHGDAADIARIICAVNLQSISCILNDDSTWAFSLANDSSTHYGKSYFDNRIRFYRDGTLYNLHLLAIPMFERHTADNIVDLVTRLLDQLCPSWRTKLIGLSSDGEPKMTGEHNGVVTQIQQQVDHKVYRTWCALHQLDLTMQHGYAKLIDGEFLKITTSIIGHLRQQQKLIAEMRSTCPKLTTRWICMGDTCDWFLEHRIRLLSYFKTPQTQSSTAHAYSPPLWWWIVAAAVRAVTEVVNITFVKLQSKDMLVSQQLEELSNLASLVCSLTGVRGPYSKEQLAEFNPVQFSTCGRWAIKDMDIWEFLHDQGSFVADCLDEIEEVDRFEVVSSIGEFVVHTVDGILDIQAERDNRNQAGEDLPPVLPHELIKLRGKEFIDIVSRHRPHLQHHWEPESLDKLEREFNQLLLKYKSEPLFKLALDNCNNDTSFTAGWKLLGPWFDTLKDFCGGLATVFPNTAIVEADFSEIGWEKDEYRLALTDLALEGVIQCKQFAILSSLV